MSDGYWFCSKCNERVEPEHVTYTETHDECGQWVSWVTDDSPPYDELRAQLAELRQAVLSAHPSGDDENPDPLEVVRTLGQEWLEQIHRRPESPIKFMDGDQERSIVWEDGDGDVGIPSGYVADESDDLPPYDDLRAQLAEKDKEIAGLRELLNTLQFCEANYRKLHDTKGGGAPETGRAWDLMRRAGDKARVAALNAAPNTDGAQ